jgi:hypothetical protein
MRIGDLFPPLAQREQYSTTRFSLMGIVTSSRLGRARTLPDGGSSFRSSQGGLQADVQALLGQLPPPLPGVHRDHVGDADDVRRDVHAAPVHEDVPVDDHLPRGGARGRESQHRDHVDQPPLQELDQVLAGVPAHPPRLGEDPPELAVAQAVDPLDLLRLPQLQPEVGDLLAPPDVCSRRVLPLLHGTLDREAAGALQIELHPFTTAELAD